MYWFQWLFLSCTNNFGLCLICKESRMFIMMKINKDGEKIRVSENSIWSSKEEPSSYYITTYNVWVWKNVVTNWHTSRLKQFQRQAFPYAMTYSYPIIYIHCGKISNLFVRALETGRKASLWQSLSWSVS